MMGRRPQVGMPSTPAAQGIPQGLSQLSTRAVDPTGKSQGVYQGGAIQAPGMWAGSSQQGLPQGKTSYLDQPAYQPGDPVNLVGGQRQPAGGMPPTSGRAVQMVSEPAQTPAGQFGGGMGRDLSSFFGGAIMRPPGFTGQYLGA